MSTWPEVTAAKDENRHEIKLSGPQISERITKNGLDSKIFSLVNLNLLNISDTCLENVPDAIGSLQNLQSLLLFSNNIKVFNENIYKLKRLKVLDMSRNSLSSLPPGIEALAALSSLNMSCNQLESFPQIKNIPSLHSLDLSKNKLSEFPDVCYAENCHLGELRVGGNVLGGLPGGVAQLGGLKTLDLADNQIKIIPKELAEIPKLKDVALKGNPIADNRLRKLVEQCRTKQVVDYVRQHCVRAGDQAEGENAQAKGGRKIKKGGGGGTNKREEPGEGEGVAPSHVVYVSAEREEGEGACRVRMGEEVKGIRGHIVVCRVTGLSFTEDSFKRFIQLQSKLHDTLCERRNAATIATHDLGKLPPGDLLYTCRPPERILIQALHRAKPQSGQQLYQQLQQEAEALRKEKKRNVYSGIHKYLYLLEGKKEYACLEDSQGNVISLPPITNSDLTKMSPLSTGMLVEVTSSQGQGVCRKVMDSFLQETLLLGVGGHVEGGGHHALHTQQVRVVDLEGNMRVVYPSKVDLVYEAGDNIRVVRN